jgi:hypothetical protein
MQPSTGPPVTRSRATRARGYTGWLVEGWIGRTRKELTARGDLNKAKDADAHRGVVLRPDVEDRVEERLEEERLVESNGVEGLVVSGCHNIVSVRTRMMICKTMSIHAYAAVSPIMSFSSCSDVWYMQNASNSVLILRGPIKRKAVTGRQISNEEKTLFHMRGIWTVSSCILCMSIKRECERR